MATTSQIVVFTVAFIIGLTGATGQLLLLVTLYFNMDIYGEKFIFIYKPYKFANFHVQFF
jgi:hypothetical protein